MQSFIRSFTLLFIVAFTASFARASNTTEYIVTPNGLTQCKGYNLTWHEGKAPFTLYVYRGCDSTDDSDAPIIEVKNILGKWAEWTCNEKAGSSIMLGVEDADGQVAYSDDVTIWKGSDDCLGKNATWKLPVANAVVVGSNVPTTAHPTGTHTGLTNVASSGPNPPKTGGASSLKASSALAVVVAMIAAVASS